MDLLSEHWRKEGKGGGGREGKEWKGRFSSLLSVAVIKTLTKNNSGSKGVSFSLQVIIHHQEKSQTP